MKKFFSLLLLVLLALQISAYAPDGTFLAVLENGNVKKTVWLKLYDDPNSPYIGQFNTRPYKSFTLQYRVEHKGVGGFNDCKADVIVFYQATGYVSRSNSSQSFYLRTMHLDRKVEDISLHDGFIEDQQNMRDAILNLDNGFYKNYQGAVEGEQRYDYINFWKDGFSVGMSPFTSAQIVFKTTNGTGITNKKEAKKSTVRISSSIHDPLTIPDDSLYDPNKSNMERWCGRWDGKNDVCEYSFELYSDFTMGLRQKAVAQNEKYKFSFTIETEGAWEFKNGELILHYDRDKKKLTLNENESSPLTEIEKAYAIEELNRQIAGIDQAIYQVLGQSQNCMKIKHGALQLYVYRERTSTYTPHLYPTVLPDGNSFENDIFFNNPPKGMVRGTLTRANGDKIIGLFKKNLGLYPVLATAYNFNKQIIATYDELKNFTDKDKELLNNNKLSDRFLTPDSGYSKYTYATGVVYEGEWLNHFPNGKGKKTFPIGSYLEGDWKTGSFIGGTGKIIYSDGGIYEGDLDSSESPHGIGRLEYDKGIYEGKFDNGSFVDNEGALTMKNGAKYKGEWDKILGKTIFGKGSMVYPDSTKIEGTWDMQGLKTAVITFSDNSTYSGEISNNSFTEGTLKCSSYMFTGEFENGYFKSGKVVYSDSGKFDGVWNNGKLTNAKNVVVTVQDTLIESFTGEYVFQDIFVGNTAVHNGYVITSTWKSGVMDTAATIVFQNGDTLIAHWENNILIPETEFKYIWADGLICIAKVNKKSELSKKEYLRRGDEEKVSRKEKKERVMLYTNIDNFSLPSLDMNKIAMRICQKLSMPKIPK